MADEANVLEGEEHEDGTVLTKPADKIENFMNPMKEALEAAKKELPNFQEDGSVVDENGNTVDPDTLTPEPTEPKETVTEPKKDEAKPAKKDEAAPTQPEKKDKPADENTEDLDTKADRIIKADPPGGGHASAKTVASWKETTKVMEELKLRSDDLKKQLDESSAKLKEAEEKVGKEAPEALLKEVETLRNRVAEFDYAALPEFKDKYDKPITQALDGIYAIFEKAEAALPDKLKDVASKIKETVGKHGIGGLDWTGLLDTCKEQKLLSIPEIKSVENYLGAAHSLEQKKAQELTTAKEAVSKRLEATKQQQEKDAEDWAKERTDYLKGVEKSIQDVRTKNKALNPPADPGEKATAEEKEAYKASLTEYSKEEAFFHKYANTLLRAKGIGLENSDKIGYITPEEFVTIFEGYMTSKASAKEIKALQTQVTELETKLDNYKKGGSTAPKTSTPTPQAPAKGATAVTSKADYNKHMADAAAELRAELGEIE